MHGGLRILSKALFRQVAYYRFIYKGYITAARRFGASFWLMRHAGSSLIYQRASGKGEQARASRWLNSVLTIRLSGLETNGIALFNQEYLF